MCRNWSKLVQMKCKSSSLQTYRLNIGHGPCHCKWSNHEQQKDQEQGRERKVTNDMFSVCAWRDDQPNSLTRQATTCEVKWTEGGYPVVHFLRKMSPTHSYPDHVFERKSHLHHLVRWCNSRARESDFTKLGVIDLSYSFLWMFLLLGTSPKHIRPKNFGLTSTFP